MKILEIYLEITNPCYYDYCIKAIGSNENRNSLMKMLRIISIICHSVLIQKVIFIFILKFIKKQLSF